MKDLTLLFLRRDGQILLAMKKRGFGVGKWNGAGGKVELGETVDEAAIRECQEEIAVTPTKFEQIGDIKFYMSEDPTFGHHAHIYVATEWEGEPRETDEMRPEWFDENKIPYNKMWVDDKFWLPTLLAGKKFHGTFTIGPNDTLENQELQDGLPE
jgi:mutator protein MutT